MISLEIPISPYIGLTKHLFFSHFMSHIESNTHLARAITTMSVTIEIRQKNKNCMNSNIDCVENMIVKLDYYNEIREITNT